MEIDDAHAEADCPKRLPDTLLPSCDGQELKDVSPGPNFKLESQPPGVVSHALSEAGTDGEIASIALEINYSDSVESTEKLKEIEIKDVEVVDFYPIEDHTEETQAHDFDEPKQPSIYYVDSETVPIKVAGAWSEFSSGDNFTKGCKWSPDGLCVLTASEDNCLRLFNLPDVFYQQRQFDWGNVTELVSILRMSEGDTIYDYSWYPLMNSSDPATCCLVSTSRLSPVHLWDAFTGDLRATYRAYDNMDEVVAANSVAFDPNGVKLFCGFNNSIRVFDVSRPGRDCSVRQLKRQGQPGIVSCIAVDPGDHDVYAAGSYLRSIGVYDERDGTQLYCLTGQTGGVTHLRFSSDGLRLFSGGRKDPEILCWDLRNPGKVLFAASRNVVTNQRIYFDLDVTETFLATGNDDGLVTVWNISEASGDRDADEGREDFLAPLCQFQAHGDCVNGVSFNTVFPILATSSGQRKFAVPIDDDEGDSSGDDMFTEKHIIRDNSLVLWWLGQYLKEEEMNETPA